MIYAFENLDDTLDRVPIAARRALDAAGFKISLATWRETPLAFRQKLTRAGSGGEVDVGAVREAISTGNIAHETIVPPGEPDAESIPPDLAPLLGQAVGEATWSALSPLDRYVLVKVARKGASDRLDRALSEIVIVPETRISHLTSRGEAHMVDVGGKRESLRRAIALARVRMQEATVQRLRGGSAPKGDVLAAARIAGIQAAKRTPELIPLCHVIRLTRVTVDLRIETDGVRIEAAAEAFDRTGVEMEALVAASTAALTVYDMLKGIDRAMIIEVALDEKTGGASGTWTRDAAGRGAKL